MLKFENLNQASIGLSRLLLNKGKSRSTRGFDCVEIDEPVLICIENPTDRYINISERKWSKMLPFAESLWIASGTNGMDLVGRYVANMYTFSDDGQFMRAAYGPRIRAYSGLSGDYRIDDLKHRNVYNNSPIIVDQLKFVIDVLTKDINSRQALITIHDPAKDTFESSGELKITKDMPCCRTIQFLVVDGKLNCTLTIRSNDLVWGFQSVNVFNFTWLQEYVANILGIPVGKYYHFVNNLHYYKDKEELIKALSKLDEKDYESPFGVWQYKDRFTLEEFDSMIYSLFNMERSGFNGIMKANLEGMPSMFRDWAKVFYRHYTKENIEFTNPYLNKLFYGRY